MRRYGEASLPEIWEIRDFLVSETRSKYSGREKDSITVHWNAICDEVHTTCWNEPWFERAVIRMLEERLSVWD